MNNKGFIVSALLYSILILFIVLVVGILVMLSGRKITVNKIKDEVINEILEIQFPNGFNNTNYQDSSGASVPKLSSGMIPIRWDGSKWVKADITQKWYDYDQKEWANAVLVTNESRTYYITANAGTMINEGDILAYLVWIPRYKYKLFNTSFESISAQTIEIKFENKNVTKSNGTSDGEWLTHPAFTFGDKELNGFWIGKFETTGTTGSPTIKPNLSSLRNYSNSVFFNTAKIFNNSIYGLSEVNDAHVIKNTEWGAVAYLSHSIYGKNSEIWKNPNSNFYTGCAGDVVNEELSNKCNSYDTSLGQNASTTGNVYGVYDMSGGAWERVMSNYDNQIALSGFSQMPAPKYYDLYSGLTLNDSIFGDALGETNGWYDDHMIIFNESSPWLARGAYNNTAGDSSGIFAFERSPGSAYDYTSFRVTLFGE